MVSAILSTIFQVILPCMASASAGMWDAWKQSLSRHLVRLFIYFKIPQLYTTPSYVLNSLADASRRTSRRLHRCDSFYGKIRAFMSAATRLMPHSIIVGQ